MVGYSFLKVDETGIEEAIDYAENFERARGGTIDPEYRQRVRAQIIQSRQLQKATAERIGRDTPSKGQKEQKAQDAKSRADQGARDRGIAERDAERDAQIKFDNQRREAQRQEAIGIQEQALRRQKVTEKGLPSRVSTPTRISNRLSPQGRLGGFGRITKPSFETRREVLIRQTVEYNQQSARDAVLQTINKQKGSRTQSVDQFTPTLRQPVLESPTPLQPTMRRVESGKKVFDSPVVLTDKGRQDLYLASLGERQIDAKGNYLRPSVLAPAGIYAEPELTKFQQAEKEASKYVSKKLDESLFGVSGRDVLKKIETTAGVPADYIHKKFAEDKLTDPALLFIKKHLTPLEEKKKSKGVESLTTTEKFKGLGLTTARDAYNLVSDIGETTVTAPLDLTRGYARDVEEHPLSATADFGIGLGLQVLTRGGKSAVLKTSGKSISVAGKTFTGRQLIKTVTSTPVQATIKGATAGVGVVFVGEAGFEAREKSKKTGEPFFQSFGGTASPLISGGIGYGAGSLAETGAGRLRGKTTTSNLFEAQVQVSAGAEEGLFSKAGESARRDLIDVARIAPQRKVKVGFEGTDKNVIEFGSGASKKSGVKIQRAETFSPLPKSDTDIAPRFWRSRKSVVQRHIESAIEKDLSGKTRLEDFSVNGIQVTRGLQGEVILPKVTPKSLFKGETKVLDIKSPFEFLTRPFGEKLVKSPTGAKGVSVQEQLIRGVFTSAENKPHRTGKDITDALASSKRILQVAKTENPVLAKKIQPLVQSATRKLAPETKKFLAPKVFLNVAQQRAGFRIIDGKIIAPSREIALASATNLKRLGLEDPFDIAKSKIAKKSKPKKSPRKETFSEMLQRRADEIESFGGKESKVLAEKVRKRAGEFAESSTKKSLKKPKVEQPRRFPPQRSVLKRTGRIPSTFVVKRGGTPSSIKRPLKPSKTSIFEQKKGDTSFFEGKGIGDSIIKVPPPDRPSILKTPDPTSFVGIGEGSSTIFRLGDPPPPPPFRFPRAVGLPYLGGSRGRGTGRDRKQKTRKRPSLLGITFEGLGIQFREAGRGFGAIGIRGTKGKKKARTVKKKVIKKKKRR